MLKFLNRGLSVVKRVLVIFLIVFSVYCTIWFVSDGGESKEQLPTPIPVNSLKDGGRISTTLEDDIPVEWVARNFLGEFAMWYSIKFDRVTGRWVDYNDSELYTGVHVDYGVPPLVTYINSKIPGYVQIDGIRFQTYECFSSNNPLCDYELMRVATLDTWDSSQLFEILSEPPTQIPTVVPTPTDKYVIVATDVEVKILYRGVDSSGNVKDLNERSKPTLYNFSDGYRLPHCDTMPPEKVDLTECSENTTKLPYVVQIVSGLPYDIGYWGMIAPNVWIALYVQKSDTWYTDWRPDGWTSQ